jgi:hypothetical protein
MKYGKYLSSSSGRLCYAALRIALVVGNRRCRHCDSHQSGANGRQDGGRGCVRTIDGPVPQALGDGRIVTLVSGFTGTVSNGEWPERRLRRRGPFTRSGDLRAPGPSNATMWCNAKGRHLWLV